MNPDVVVRIDKSIEPGHDNDVYIAGYSDQILRFIAERGDGGQLLHVEKIDVAYSLADLPPGLLQRMGHVTSSKAVAAATGSGVGGVKRPLPLTRLVPRLVRHVTN